MSENYIFESLTAYAEKLMSLSEVSIYLLRNRPPKPETGAPEGERFRVIACPLLQFDNGFFLHPSRLSKCRQIRHSGRIGLPVWRLSAFCTSSFSIVCNGEPDIKRVRIGQITIPILWDNITRDCQKSSHFFPPNYALAPHGNMRSSMGL